MMAKMEIRGFLPIATIHTHTHTHTQSSKPLVLLGGGGVLELIPAVSGRKDGTHVYEKHQKIHTVMLTPRVACL